MTQQFTSSEVRDLENRIVQRLSWLREGSPIDMKAFTADIETLLLQAHSAQAQLPINHSDEEPYPDAAKDPFWKVPGMVDTRPKAQTPAASVTDAMVERGLKACIQDSDARLPRYKVVRSIIEAALAAQENPNG